VYKRGVDVPNAFIIVVCPDATDTMKLVGVFGVAVLAFSASVSADSLLPSKNKNRLLFRDMFISHYTAADDVFCLGSLPQLLSHSLSSSINYQFFAELVN
jgi:hypothetical protein